MEKDILQNPGHEIFRDSCSGLSSLRLSAFFQFLRVSSGMGGSAHDEGVGEDKLPRSGDNNRSSRVKHALFDSRSSWHGRPF